jgi:hypothetical protein
MTTRQTQSVVSRLPKQRQPSTLNHSNTQTSTTLCLHSMTSTSPSIYKSRTLPVPLTAQKHWQISPPSIPLHHFTPLLLLATHIIQILNRSDPSIPHQSLLPALTSTCPCLRHYLNLPSARRLIASSSSSDSLPSLLAYSAYSSRP